METEKYPPFIPDTGLHIIKYMRRTGQKTQKHFGVRTVLCILLFMAFVLMDNQDIDIAQVSTDQIVSAVEEETQVQDVWMDLAESVR